MRNGLNEESLINDENIRQWNEDEVHTPLFILLVTLNLLLAAILIYCFVRNIVYMIINTTLSPRSALEQHQIKLLAVAIRYALLCSIAIIITNLQFTGWILFSFEAFENQEMHGIYFVILNNWFWDVVLITNFTCILLTFSRITKDFDAYSFCCSHCHRCCQKNVENCILKHVAVNKVADRTSVGGMELEIKMEGNNSSSSTGSQH